MVDKIPECGHTAVHGLQGELAALHSKQDPLEQLMDNMRQTLEATKDILIQSRDNTDTGQTDLGKISEVTKNLFHSFQHHIIQSRLLTVNPRRSHCVKRLE